MENPYSFLPLHVDRYYGSEAILKKALHTIGGMATASMNITGLGGMGKSHLLRHLAQPYVLYEYANEFAEPFCRQPYLLFPILIEYTEYIQEPARFVLYKYDEALVRYRAFLEEKSASDPSIANLLAAETEGKQEPLEEKSNDTLHSSDSALYSIYTRISGIAQRRIRPVFLIDDLDLVLERFEDDIEVIRLWRPYACIIASSRKPLSSINPRASAVFGTFNYDTINALTEKEVHKLLSEPLETLAPSVRFPPEDKEYLIQLCGRHLSLLILGAKHLWSTREVYGLLLSMTPLDADQRLILRNRLFLDSKHWFQSYWQDLEEDERATLTALAHGGHVNLGSTSLASLSFKGLVYPNGQRIKIFSVLFEEFVRSQTVPNNEIGLTGKEAKLYLFIKENASRICYYEEIWQAVWGNEEGELPLEKKKRLIQVTVHRLNQRLWPATREKIIGVRGVGYRLSQATPE